MSRSRCVTSRIDPSLALSPRKAAVLRALADGLPAKGIARSLGISVNTVNQYLHELRGTLAATSNPNLVVLGIRHGFVDDPRGQT